MFKNKKILITEKNGLNGKEIYYVQPEGQNVVVKASLKSSFKDDVIHWLVNILIEIFLPQGYPSSVSKDYAKYQLWDTAQAFCSTITGILATQSIMKGVGVGDENATSLAATITWVLKDSTGHISRIGFAWWKGTSLDADSKKWRLVADCLNDAAMGFELALPFFMGYTMYIFCLSTAMKAIVGVAGGATRAALTQHQAIRGNLADVAAKDGSQETAVNLIASAVAIFILTYIGENVWLLFFIFTILHLLCNYFAVTAVCLKTFNKVRFLRLFDTYFHRQSVLTPELTNTQEHLFFGNVTEMELSGFKIIVGNSLQGLISQKKITANDLERAVDVFKESEYLLIVDVHNKCIYSIFKETLTSEDVIQSYYHAIMLGLTIEKFLDKTKPKLLDSAIEDYIQKIQKQNDDKISSCLMFTYSSELKHIIDSNWLKLSKQLKESEWDLTKQLILLDEWRAKW